ncbi:MAG: hypothetical protein ISR55_10400 [Bacteroidetes bacterium]|nr:hypothetical protein [Bacteroidota bacterium]MBL6964225.1 hypothetical protein [Bacteroidota bacterium]
MKRFILIFLPFILLSCKDRLQLVENDPVEVIESEKVYISQIPRVVKKINDSIIAFVDDNKSIVLLNTVTGKLEREIIQNFKFKKFLKDYVNLSDSLIPYDISKHPNIFVAQYPLIKINSFEYEDDQLFVLYTITNPLYENGAVHIRFANALVTSNMDGEIKSVELVELFQPDDDDDILYTPDDGFGYIPGSKTMVINTINQKLMNSIVSSFEYNRTKYSFSNSELFPYPGIKDKAKQDQTRMIYPFEFRIHGDQIYFTNGKDLYSYTNGNNIINTDRIKSDDSISFIKSFDIILNKREKIRFFAFLEDVLPNMNAFDKSNKFLALTNSEGNKILKRIPVGRFVSGLVYQNHNIVFLEEFEEKIIIRKYQIN